jgi:hypothetical protein
MKFPGEKLPTSTACLHKGCGGPPTHRLKSSSPGNRTRTECTIAARPCETDEMASRSLRERLARGESGYARQHRLAASSSRFIDRSAARLSRPSAARAVRAASNVGYAPMPSSRRATRPTATDRRGECVTTASRARRGKRPVRSDPTTANAPMTLRTTTGRRHTWRRRGRCDKENEINHRPQGHQLAAVAALVTATDAAATAEQASSSNISRSLPSTIR